ncbi:MAG: CCA tRNA nucleotidyltransferase [Candidatus Rokubacteria bacterium]|nr:CCA tRNA nucleotidyltransferase [Candidatus Rokubacteria bacterium]
MNEALRLITRRHLRLLAARSRNLAGVILPADLRRARALSLGARRAWDVARWGIPVVTPRAAEVTVRRHLFEGAAAVLVREGRRVVGAVEPSIPTVGRPALSLLPRLERQLPAETRGLLRRIGGIGESMGCKVYAVGGFVRDLLLGRQAAELDIVVEGDGLAVARRLASELGGTLVVHATFGTATLEGGGALRIDVATARQEHYRLPGALPEVTPASVAEDLRRRDFSINAMAMVLSATGFGDLLDPVRGASDLARRRIRILHPLSFVEDPTRMFRAIRYQTRLGFALDRGSLGALRFAIDVAPYPALSGQRLTAELELIVAEEPTGPRSLITLGRLGAFTILDPSYRFSPRAARKVIDLGRLRHRLSDHGIALDPLPLGLLALVGHLSQEAAERCLRRLAVSGEPLSRLTGALREGPVLAQRLTKARAAPPSVRAAYLRGRSLESLGGAWLAGGESARRQVEWFLAHGRTVQTLLGGDDLLALGVTRGPSIRQLLDRLRDCRLDGVAVTREQELALVHQWIGPGNRAEAQCG